MPQLINATKCAECAFKSLLFDKLEGCELELLDQSKTELKYKKGEIIIAEGQEIKEFVYVKKGLVKLSKRTEDQKDHIINISKPKAFIGFLTVFSQKHYHYSITSLGESNICFIDIDVIKKAVMTNGIFALDVLSKICDVSDEIIHNRVNIGAKQLRGRIAYLLIFLSKEIFCSTSFDLPLTRRELGELINMSTGNVIRILSEFRRDGILQIDGHTIEIENLETLDKISRFG